MVFVFDDLVLNEATRELRRADATVELQPKVFDLLVFLLRHKGQLVTRQQLLDGVWAGTIVGDAAISRAVREVRRAVGDDGEAQRIIKTVHARGFRFVAEVVERRENVPLAAAPVASPDAPIEVAATRDDDFIGRAVVLRQLGSLLTEVTKGAGRTILISGEPGIGKTALLERFAGLATSQGVPVHVGRCSEADGVPALWPWEQLVRSIARGLDLASASPAVRAAADDIAPLLGTSVTLPEPRDSAQARFRIQDGCVRFIAEVARERPLVLIVDDLQLADPGSLALMHHFAPHIRSSQVALVAAMREQGGVVDPALARTADALARGSASGKVLLHGLDTDEIVTFVHRLIGSSPERPVAESLRRWTGGNPLFLSHVELDMEDHGPASSKAVAMPRALREAVDETLDVLSPEARTVLQTASVAGQEFRAVVVAKAMGVRSDDLLDALGEALEYRIVRRVQSRIDTFAFVHGVLRDALYARLSLGERARSHAATGDALATVYGEATGDHAEELAHHYLRAAAAGRADDAVRYTTLAADHAVARESFQHAATLYRAGLDALPLATAGAAAAWRARILVRLGSALGREGRVGEAGLAFRDAANAAVPVEDDSTGKANTGSAPFVRDVQTLRESFQHIVARASQLTTRFYQILFSRHPELRALFRRNSPPIQAKMMNDTVMAIIDRIEDAPWLRASLAALGARHAEFDVTESMYPRVGECLLTTLAEAAGDDIWVPRVATAWEQAFDAISTMMIEGARAAQRRAR